MDVAEHSERKSSDGGTSDHEALVDVPLSFELSGFEPLPVATRGASASMQGSFLHFANKSKMCLSVADMALSFSRC